MATTAKTTKTKTKPAKKPATKPTGASVKPKQTKTVKATAAKPAKTSAKAPAKSNKSNCRACEIIFGIIMIVAALTIATGAIFYMFFGIDRNTVNVATGTGGNVVTKFINIPEHNVSFLVPTSFKQIEGDDLKNLYNAEEITAAYANNDKAAVVSISQSSDKFTNDDIEKFINTVRTTISADGAKDIQTNFYTVDNYNIGTIKFTSGSADATYPYRFIAVFSKDDKATLVAFECKEELRKEWEVVGDAIIKSITIHE